ncbi:MAG TPA: hypothetical protein VFE70_06315, partial [Candidatus Elarobacter sp.]|nr:hypothetical protein [Candidatus Elarobacter sp.]
PLPSPNAQPRGPLIAFPVAMLAPASTYSVTVQDGAGPCPEAQPTTVGSFSTQKPSLIGEFSQQRAGTISR